MFRKAMNLIILKIATASWENKVNAHKNKYSPK
jgi:hypothetical protein